MSKRKRYDWEVIEREYRLGVKSLRVLSAEFGPSISTISKRATKEGWTQDKSEEVRQRTRAALLRETQPKKPEKPKPRGKRAKETCDETLRETPPPHPPPNTPSRDDIERAVAANVQVIREHRSLIARTLSLASRLLQTTEAGEGEDSAPKVDPKSHGEMFKTISLGLSKVLPLERQAFNLDDDTPAKALEGLISNLDPASRKRLAEAMRDE